MLKLDPLPAVNYKCPECGEQLSIIDYHIPGMRTVAELECSKCDRRYYVDLPLGHGLVYPAMVNAETGNVYQEAESNWFGDWLRESYDDRKDVPVSINKEVNKDINKPIILNCLDGLYGHSLLKLLNAQYYIDEKPDFDLIVLIPSNLKWLVPSDVAGVWSFDFSLSQGKEWNDWISREIKSFLSQFENVWASVAFSHTYPDDYDISRFTDVKPFSIDRWSESTPTVTYIWRDDRLWAPSRHSAGFSKQARGTVYWAAEKSGLNLGIYEQRHNVARLAKSLKSKIPNIEFTVAGLNQPGGLPDFITDIRTATPDDEYEKKLCNAYAKSHTVVGIHGSNMLLPSAHAGSVIELVPPKRWGNMTQDLLFEHDIGHRESIYQYRHIPRSTSPAEVAAIVQSLLERKPHNRLHMARKWTDHESLNIQERRSKWKSVD